MSVEGGIRGEQRRIVCVNCGKVFFAWRPDTVPGAKIKCYFCKKEMEDEASRRIPAPPPAPAAAPPPAVAAPASAPEAPASSEPAPS